MTSLCTIGGTTIRLRPVLMTSLCTIGGTIPLIVGAGAGAEARRALGVVVSWVAWAASWCR